MIATPIVAIAGPTGSGKSNLALKLAGLFAVAEKKVEIISADSVAVYRGFDIGTAKPSLEERRLVPHHLIDIRDAEESFTAADFVDLADPIIQRLRGEGKIPIIVGGTGFYLRALFQGMTEQSPEETEKSEQIKRELEETLEDEGIEKLYAEMLERDPALATKIHQNDHYRVIRALQAMRATGNRWSELNETAKLKPPRYENYRLFCLDVPREILEPRVRFRTEQMIEAGLLAEIKGLLAAGISLNAKPMQSVGYKETLEYIDGKLSEPEWKEAIVRNTLFLAKQQRTWFRGEKRVEWLSGDPLLGIVKALGLDGMLEAE
jgi:tRNA dimethylallyltransferase